MWSWIWITFFYSHIFMNVFKIDTFLHISGRFSKIQEIPRNAAQNIRLFWKRKINLPITIWSHDSCTLIVMMIHSQPSNHNRMTMCFSFILYLVDIIFFFFPSRSFSIDIFYRCSKVRAGLFDYFEQFTLHSNA